MRRTSAHALGAFVGLLETDQERRTPLTLAALCALSAGAVGRERAPVG